MARTRKPNTRRSLVTLPTIGLRKTSTQNPPVRRPDEATLPDVPSTSARVMSDSSPVPKILSTRHGPLELLSEKSFVLGSSRVTVKLGKRPLRKRKARKDLKIGDLRQSIWKFDQKDRLRRKDGYLEWRKASVWRKPQGMGLGLLPGFETCDFINRLLMGRLGDRLPELPQGHVAGGQKQASTNRLPVLPPLTDPPKPVLATRDKKFKSGERDAGQQLGSTNFRLSSVGLEPPVNSPAIDQTVTETNKQLPPIDTELATIRSDESTFLSSGQILFRPWKAADHLSSKHRLLPPISQPVKTLRSVSPSYRSSQHNSSAPVVDFLNVQFGHNDHSGSPRIADHLGAAHDQNIMSQTGVVPFLPSVGGHSLKATKPLSVHESGRSTHHLGKQTVFLELETRSLTHLPKSLGGRSLLPQLQRPGNGFSAAGKLKVRATSHETTPISGVMPPDNSVASGHHSEYQDMGPVPPSSAFVHQCSNENGLAPISQQVFRYLPMSREGTHHPAAGGLLQLDEDIDSGQQCSSDYESDTGRPTSPENLSLAMVTFRMNSRGKLVLSPTGRYPLTIAVKSKHAVKNLVQKAIAVSRRQQRKTGSWEHMNLVEDVKDCTDIHAARAVIAVSRKQQRPPRPQEKASPADCADTIDARLHTYNGEDSIDDVVDVAMGALDLPSGIFDASTDLEKYLDAAGFPPGSALFVPPGEHPLVLTPDGGVVALPTSLSPSESGLSGNSAGLQNVVPSSVQSEQEGHEADTQEYFVSAAGSWSGHQHSTCSDSGVYENSHHILHNAVLEAISASPCTSAGTRNSKTLVASGSSQNVQNAADQWNANSEETSTDESKRTSAGTRREFEAVINAVSSQGAQDVIDQLKRNSRESSIERTPDEPVLSEEEKFQRWQEEFRAMAMEQMEKEWVKYKQLKLDQEQEKLQEEEAMREEQARKAIEARREDDKPQYNGTGLIDQPDKAQGLGPMLEKSQSERVPVSEDDESGVTADHNDEEISRHSGKGSLKTKAVIPTRTADSDEENTSEIGERPVSTSSSTASDPALETIADEKRSYHQSSMIDVDAAAAAAAAVSEKKQQSGKHVTTLIPDKVKKRKKKVSPVQKESVLLSPKRTVQPKPPKSRKKGRAELNKSNLSVCDEIIDHQMHSADTQDHRLTLTETTKNSEAVETEVYSCNKTDSDSEDIDFKEMDNKVVEPVAGIPPGFHSPPHNDDTAGTVTTAEECEARDEVAILPLERASNAILTDGYDSEASVSGRRLSRLEKSKLAAERRRQEVERKRQEQKEAKRKAAEEEVRMAEMKREAEERLAKQIAEKRRKLREEREARERAEIEAGERHQAELRRKEMMQRQAEEMKRKLQEELARRQQEAALLLEAERLAAEAEAKRKHEEEERRLMWEKRLKEEQDEQKRHEMEEQMRLEEEQARLLEEERRKQSAEEKKRLQRQEEDKAKAMAQRKWYSDTVLEALNLMLDLRLNQEFSYSYFTLIPSNSSL